MQINEIKIPVSWGYIAAKTWGDKSNYPVIVVHGRQDNAASFDYLIPRLPVNYYYVCMDLPGHGRSSTPKGHLKPDALDYCMVLKLILDYFKWKECYALGHSMGGVIIILMEQLYPSYFKKIAIIDGTYTLPVEIPDYRKYVTGKLNGIIKYEQAIREKKEQPTYSYEEALKRVSDSRYDQPLPKEKAEPILKRMIQSVGDGKYRFTSDPRTKYVMFPVHDNQYSIDLIKSYPITCPMLLIVNLTNEVLLKIYTPVLKQYEQQKNITVKYIQANHDMHITIPDVVAPFICDLFNEMPNSKL